MKNQISIQFSVQELDVLVSFLSTTLYGFGEETLEGDRELLGSAADKICASWSSVAETGELDQSLSKRAFARHLRRTLKER